MSGQAHYLAVTLSSCLQAPPPIFSLYFEEGMFCFPFFSFFQSAIGAAMKYDNTEVVTLLERFKKDASQTRHAMRVELGWYDGAAAEMFALAVFVSDGILQVKDTTPTPAARFFSIARRLPLELQMIVCHLVVGSAKETISGNDSEVAFKSLARTLLWSSFFAN